MEGDWKQEWDLLRRLAENALWNFVNKVQFKSWSTIRHESLGSQTSVVPMFTQTLIWQFIYVQQWFKLRWLERAADAGVVPTHLPQVTISTARMGQRLINQCPSFCVSQIGVLRQASSSFCSCLSHSIPAVRGILREGLAYIVGIDDFFDRCSLI